VHTSHTQTETHTQAKTHAFPCANPYGDADCYADGYGNAHTHRYADSRCSDLGAARGEWDGQILD